MQWEPHCVGEYLRSVPDLFEADKKRLNDGLGMSGHLDSVYSLQTPLQS